MTPLKSTFSFLLLLSFLEGAAVMTVELAGAKMLAPVFGTSLYVWAATLGITLLALTAGYYTGGYVSSKSTKTTSIFQVLLLAGIFTCAMPVISNWILKATIDMDVRIGSSISLLIFMMPPLIFMGMTSPLIIRFFTQHAEMAGKSAGTIYAISTLGGILSTFLSGFYLLPEVGIKYTVLISGLTLVIPAAIGLVTQKQYKNLFVLVLFFPLGYSLSNYNSDLEYKILYNKEGVLGQVKIVEHPYITKQNDTIMVRAMLVNNTAQTISNLNKPGEDLWDYAYYFPAAASILPKGSKALLCGLGGGTIVRQFQKLGFEIEAVEIDERIKETAIAFFDVNTDIPIHVNDARHFIKNTKNKYDLVTYDMFLSETPPAHLFTKECFEEVKNILNEKGMIMMNFYGFISGEKGKAARSVFNTLTACGFQVNLLVTPADNEFERNLIFLASLDNKDFSAINYREEDKEPISNISQHFLNTNEIDFSDAPILSDDKPQLEHIYLPAAIAWRQGVNEQYTKYLMRN
jgi:predicted membrane-bound spermidine synthase